MKKYTFYFLYPFMAAALIVLMVLAVILSPFLALYSVIKEVDTLPGFWQWFSTADDDLDGGISQEEYPNYYNFRRKPTSKELEQNPLLEPKRWPYLLRNSLVRLWWYRMCWICRNPAQGFSWHWFRAGELLFAPVFDYDFGDSNENGISSGYYCRSIDTKGRQYFSLKGKWWPCKWLGIRYYFGWKLTRKDGYHILVCALGVRRG